MLPNFNIYIGEKRTSIRLSPIIVNAVERIAAREHCELDELCSHIDRTKGRGIPLSTAIREFAIRYFMDAATEAGHRKAGHGELMQKARLRRARPASRKTI